MTSVLEEMSSALRPRFLVTNCAHRLVICVQGGGIKLGLWRGRKDREEGR